METSRKKELEQTAAKIRGLTIKMIGNVGVGHVGGCMSIVEVVTVLYFDSMHIDPAKPRMPGRDRLVLSKGHAGPAVYSALALKGYFPLSELETLNKPLTRLPSHCDMNRTTGIDMTAGSLGQGLSCAVGMAMASKMDHGQEYIYAIIGDGESQEGQIWEASMTAAQYRLDNLMVFLDHNKLQIDGTVEEVMSLINPVAKWEAFGFKVFEVDGHDVAKISEAIKAAKAYKGKPLMIVLHTVKGKGISFVEQAGVDNHSMKVSKEQVAIALEELGWDDLWNH
jgi:transketolase